MKVSVVGPVYQEIVEGRTRPGSAARASTILASLGSGGVTLYGFGSPEDRKRAAIVEDQGVTVSWLRQHETDGWPPETMFRYPMVWGEPHITPRAREEVGFIDRVSHSDAMLVFGSLMGRPIVDATVVVYDPQDGADAKHFVSNGSTATQKYYALNLRELFTLTNSPPEAHPVKALERLVADWYLDGCVVRLGPLGYLHFDGHDLGWVPTSSRRVLHRIGAGGAFSAFLLHELAIHKASLREAVSFAASGAGKFQETGADVFGPNTQLDIRNSIPVSTTNVPPLTLRDATICLLAPKISTSERWLREQLRGAWTSLGATVVDASEVASYRQDTMLTVIAICGREYASSLVRLARSEGETIVLLELPIDPREQQVVSRNSAYVSESPIDVIMQVARRAQQLQIERAQRR